MAAKALGQFRIIDLSTHIAGPWCTKLFADYGAKVVKVEPPNVGDICRRIGPFFNDDPHEESSHIEKYFWAPTSLKLDSEGRMYVTESNRHRVQIYDKA